MTAAEPSRAPPYVSDLDRSAYASAARGHLPAEALPTRLRWRLVAALHRMGWTDVEVAEWTRMTPYTAGRIREGMGQSSGALAAISFRSSSRCTAPNR
jgi:hypothetical protein